MGSPPYLGEQWVPQFMEVDTVASKNVIENNRLQVLIMYSGWASSHTALRLITDDGSVVFWDPAGDYGRFDEDWSAQFPSSFQDVRRDQDLIVEGTPDLDTFVRWRWTLDDTRVEVFEWDVDREYARTLRGILLAQDETGSDGDSFSTLTFPMFCTVATSQFLRRFGPPMITVPDWYFFPHRLAEILYGQDPSRLRVFFWNGPETVYVPTGPHSVRR